MTPADAFSSESIVAFKVTWNWVGSLVKVRDIHIRVANNTKKIIKVTMKANLNDPPSLYGLSGIAISGYFLVVSAYDFAGSSV